MDFGRHFEALVFSRSFAPAPHFCNRSGNRGSLNHSCSLEQSQSSLSITQMRSGDEVSRVTSCLTCGKEHITLQRKREKNHTSKGIFVSSGLPLISVMNLNHSTVALQQQVANAIGLCSPTFLCQKMMCTDCTHKMMSAQM